MVRHAAHRDGLAVLVLGARGERDLERPRRRPRRRRRTARRSRPCGRTRARPGARPSSGGTAASPGSSRARGTTWGKVEYKLACARPRRRHDVAARAAWPWRTSRASSPRPASCATGGTRAGCCRRSTRSCAGSGSGRPRSTSSPSPAARARSPACASASAPCRACRSRAGVPASASRPSTWWPTARVPAAGPIVALLEAFRGEVFWAVYDGEGRLVGERSVGPLEAALASAPAGSAFVGSGAAEPPRGDPGRGRGRELSRDERLPGGDARADGPRARARGRPALGAAPVYLRGAGILPPARA